MIEKETNNLELWDSVETTDPKYTKNFKGNGGFEGTAINPTWLIKRATEKWGPMGSGWHLETIRDEVVTGQSYYAEDGTHLGDCKIHRFTGRLVYPNGFVEHDGATTFVGKNKYGLFTDEEAFKKSRTDCLSKCLSVLGFASDVYLGSFDDNKHVNKPEKGDPAPTRKEPAKDERTNIEKGQSILSRVKSSQTEASLESIIGYKEYSPIMASLMKEDRELWDSIVKAIGDKRKELGDGLDDNLPPFKDYGLAG